MKEMFSFLGISLQAASKIYLFYRETYY